MPESAAAQSVDVQYELHTLGWKAFQDLALAVTSEVLGQSVARFAESRDGGRDGAFHGLWSEAGRESDRPPSFTVQCKFTSRRDTRIRWQTLEDEIEKARRLGDLGLANRYILITNYRLGAETEQAIRESFLHLDGIEQVHVYGYEWLVQIIRESPRLRILVPRIYGLGDLSQIIDERALLQARELLSGLGEDLAKLVVTDAHKRSAYALVEHGFVLLLGEPASGKSTIAASLAVGALDNWNASTYKLRTPEDFIRHWNPHEPKQLFWFDDAFGATQYERELALQWNRVFPELNTAIRRGSRVLFTSRNYVYNYALHDLKLSAFPLLSHSQVVINVQELTIREKEQILYNHLKLGRQPRIFRGALKRFLPMAARNPKFLPETARRLGDPLFTRTLVPMETTVRKFVEEPLAFLLDTIRSLDEHSKAALILIFMTGGRLASPIHLDADLTLAVDLLGSNVAGVRKALKALNESLIRKVNVDSGSEWIFRHPTISDALGELVGEDPEMLDIYLKGTPPLKLIREISCGAPTEVALRQGVKVFVPTDRYNAVLAKINQLPQRTLYPFLTHRWVVGQFELNSARRS